MKSYMLWLLILLSFFSLSVTRNISRAQRLEAAYGEDPTNTLNIYLPGNASGPWPTVVLMHGTGVDKEYFEGTGTVQDLLQEGYAAVSIEYRVPTQEDPLNFVSDLACAVAWTQASSEVYGFDPESIVIMGHSRGGSGVALFGVISDLEPLMTDCGYELPEDKGIQGIVTYGAAFGTIDGVWQEPSFIAGLSEYTQMSLTESLQVIELLAEIPPAEWRSSPKLTPEVRKILAALPITWVDGDEPPFLLIHGDIDEQVPVAESEIFVEILHDLNVDAELLIIPGGHHRVDQVSIHNALFAFLEAKTAH